MTSDNKEIWFVVGSQHLYGEDALKQVAVNAEAVVAGLNGLKIFPFPIVLKPVATTPEQIGAVCREANYRDGCLGVITWLHTFSPAKMWSVGLKLLDKPLLQLHTQMNAEIPWSTMDMDFMNLNQTAHGGREFGFMVARLRKPCTVVVGHWQEERVHKRVSEWMRVCAGIYESRHLKVARFGDNMREVAVTEGDKVEAQVKFGFSVSAYAVHDLVDVVDAVSDADVAALVDEYETLYTLTDHVKKGGDKRQNVLDAARIELGLRRFLEAGGFKAFITNFETLKGLKQLPGLGVQRLMKDGYGFAGEGDWKTAALLRIMKVMAGDAKKGTSFMEDYTYNFAPDNDLVLGAHMLEVCPSLAVEAKPTLDVQPLGIGGKDDPARLIFSTPAGPAINAALMDMGNRFRLLIAAVNVISQPQPLPKLPVARAVWQCEPDFATGIEAWILAGGSHHTVLSQALSVEHLRIFAEETGIECVVIDRNTTIPALRNELRWNDVAY
ncbi:MAG: L-arabinose isomerase [Methylobacteriaceae bacterium]|jgi:L-arabinose isomerase|nr:L-arabinose isomerase [Methylobacteriaceae bacterium]